MNYLQNYLNKLEFSSRRVTCMSAICSTLCVVCDVVPHQCIHGDAHRGDIWERHGVILLQSHQGRE